MIRKVSIILIFLICMWCIAGCDYQETSELTKLFGDNALAFNEHFEYQHSKYENVKKENIIKYLGEENKYYAYNIDTFSYSYTDDYYYKVTLSLMMNEQEMFLAQQKAKQLAKEMNYGTTYEKIKRVHDYIIANCEYSIINPGPYNCLINGRANCTGFALSFLYIMDEMKIPCEYITDDGHAWNTVCIDGVWFNIDLTYDENSGYDFFLKSNADWREHSRGNATSLFSFTGEDSDLEIKNVKTHNQFMFVVKRGPIVLVAIGLVVYIIIHSRKDKIKK